MHPKNFSFPNGVYKKWILRHPCLVCQNPITDPHHVWHSGGQRPNDFLIVPLCREHHGDYHNLGIDTFEKRYGVDLAWEIINFLGHYIQGNGEEYYALDRRGTQGLF